ncbi:MAG: hypothetical protein AB4911_10080 [Oscillochloridaceae bacterium umkhey_bin13]
MRLLIVGLVGGLVLLGVWLGWGSSVVQANEPPPQLATSCPPSIPFGELFDCAISALGERDSYDFNATTNDSFIIRMLRTSGTLRPQITVRNQNGVVVCTDLTDGALLTLSCTATSSGAYTLEVNSFTNAATGNYQFYMQRLNGVGNATPLSFGVLVQASLASAIESNTYSFTASQNDLVRLRLYRTSGTMRPQVRVFNAAGVEQCGSYAFDALITLENCALDEAGDYSVLIDSQASVGPGNYDLHVQRLTNPGAAVPITAGSVITGTLGRVAELDVFQLEAEANDQLILRLVKETGAFRPRLSVLNSNGTNLCSSYSFDVVVTIEPCALPASGTYSILVDDQSLASTGGYRLHVQRRNNPGQANPISFGQTLAGSVRTIADFSTYSFEAKVSDQVQLTMRRTAGAFRPRVTVYNPNGVLVCSTYSFGSEASKTCDLTVDGTHTIIADDQSLAAVGTYTLNLACTSGRCGPAGAQQSVYLPMVRR